MLKRFTLIGLMGIVLLFPWVAESRDMPRGKWWHLPRVAQAIQITDEEKRSLDDQFMQSARKLIDLKGEVEKEILDLEYMLNGSGESDEAILNQFERVQTARTVLAKEHFRFLLETRKILGHERFSRLKEMFKL